MIQVTPVPDAGDLDELDARAQRVLGELVETAGGRFDSRTSIPVAHLELLTLVLDGWGRRYGVQVGSNVYFDGHPGLWRAFDRLYPLQAPRRWDLLRKAVIVELEKGSWCRRGSGRGQTFDITPRVGETRPGTASPPPSWATPTTSHPIWRDTASRPAARTPSGGAAKPSPPLPTD